MGSVSAFPRRIRHVDSAKGTVHVMPSEDGGYGVSHESASGNSWGGYALFDDPGETVATAYRWARDQYDGCDVAVWPTVIDALPVSPSPPEGLF